MGAWTFVRHGESVANAQGWLAGHADSPLTERGRQQARAAAAQLRGRAFSRAFSSDLIRASATAQIILEGREPGWVEVPALRERSLGSWADADKQALRDAGAMARLLTWELGPPNGESQRMVAERALRWLARLDEVDGATLIVAHGGLIRVLLGLLDGTPRADIGRLVVDNAHPHHREPAPGQWARLLSEIT